MTSKELTQIREDRKLSKKEFAGLLGVTPMLLGKYEKGTCAIPDSIAEKLKEVADKAAAVEIETKKAVRSTARKAQKVIEDAVAAAREAVEEKAAAQKSENRKESPEDKKVHEPAPETPASGRKAPKVFVQSLLGGTIAADEVLSRIPGDADAVYIKPEENKAFWVKGGESGDITLW